MASNNFALATFVSLCRTRLYSFPDGIRLLTLSLIHHVPRPVPRPMIYPVLSPVVITPVPKLVDGVQEQMQQRQKAGSARMMHTCGISPGRSLVAINEHLENAERNARKRTTVGPGPGGSKTARLVGLSQYK